MPIGDLPFRVFAGLVRAADNKGQVLVAVEVDGSGLSYVEKDGRFVESLEVSIVAADQRARVQGGDRQTVQPEPHAGDPRTRESRRRSPGFSVALPPGRYQIRISAHEATGWSGRYAAVHDLEIPDYAKTPFSLSGVFLTSSSAGAYATGSDETTWKGLLPAPPVATRSSVLQTRSTCFIRQSYATTQGTPPRDHVDEHHSGCAGRAGRLFQSRDSRVVSAPRSGTWVYDRLPAA